MPKTEELSGRVTLDLTPQPKLPADYETFKQVAEHLQVIDEDSYQIAARMIQQEVRWGQAVDTFFNEGREQANRLHRWFTGTISKLKAGYAVRGTLEPRMIAYKREQENRRRQEEQRILREQEQAEARARAEAAAIQKKAQEEADALRRDGEMKAAREIQAQAAEQMQAVTQQAEAMAEVGIILPAAPKVEGLKESRPWCAQIEDTMLLIKAVAEGKIPLFYTMPKRGGGTEEVMLFEANMSILNYAAKRLGKEDIGFPGAVGVRDFRFNISRSAPAAPSGDGW